MSSSNSIDRQKRETLTRDLRVAVRIPFLLILAVLAPAIKLGFFNQAYFGLSLIEIVVSAFLLGLFLSIPLTIAASINMFSRQIYLLAMILFIASVISSFLIPVGLKTLDGGEATGFEVRTEAFTLFVGILLAYIAFVALVRSQSKWNKALFYITQLRNVAIIYVIAFVIYAGFGGLDLIAFSGRSRVIAQDVPVSNQKNIFIVSFDQVQGSFLKGYLAKHPDKEKVFDGFTFYYDAATTFPNTNYSLASVFTGRIAENAQEKIGWAINSSESILKVCQEAGFEVYFANWPRTGAYTCILCDDRIDGGFNYLKSFELLRHGVNLAAGLDLGSLAITLTRWFSEAPYDPILADHWWQIDLHKFATITESLSLSSERPTLYFMHFLGTHQPFIYDSDCGVKTVEKIHESQDITGAKSNVSCMIALIERFISRLKELAIYDTSKIFIVSDHGYELNINRLRYGRGGETFFGEASDKVGDKRNIKPVGSYNPMLLFKDFGAPALSGLSFSGTPVSLIDIAPTICETLPGCQKDWEGRSLRSKVEPDRRRLFWQYLGGSGSERRGPDGLDKLHEGLDEWWEIREFRGSIYPNLAYAMGYNIDYVPGEIVRFNRDAGAIADSIVQFGWSDAEAVHRWTVGHEARLALVVEDAQDTDLLLRLHANAYLADGQLPHQEVLVEVNGQLVATWKVRGLQWYEAVIPAHVVGDGTLDVVFVISDPTAPCDVTDSRDCRKVGVAARQLVIDHAR